MTRAPEVGDYVVCNAWRRGDGRCQGTVHRIGRVTAATVWLDGNDEEIKADRSKWRNDPWWRITYVDPAEATRWIAASKAMKAWRKAIPSGARWAGGYSTAVEDMWVVVDDREKVGSADHADATAAIYAAVAAWLRAKPSADDLLITVEAA